MFLGIKVNRVQTPSKDFKGKAYIEGIDNMHVRFIQMGNQLIIDEYFYYDDDTPKSPLPKDAGLYQEILTDLTAQYFKKKGK
ncbi:MAG: hypothetical protein LBS33_00980 [Streptococcaceae bacterium]|nr:hypothetical protein [Streptococcaceae bacterium]